MGQKNCHITLEDPSDVYRPGQTLNGIVEYTFDTPQIIKEISLKFKGRGSTSWSETVIDYDSKGNSTQRRIHYWAEEEYFATSICLIRPSSGGEMELPAGKHTYPFSFTLPNSVPSSFKGKYGYIRYTIKSTLKRPWKCNTNTEVPFTVISHLDLNSDPDYYKRPIHIHLEKHYGCFCCLSGPLVLDLYLPVSGYCSGQAIPIDVSCENGSKVHINNFKIALTKTVTYHSEFFYKTKTEKGLIAELSLGQLAAHSSKDWKLYMQVPEMVPSGLYGCTIIDLDYHIKVTCVPSGCHMKSDEKETITLGTVPIVGFDCLLPGQPPVPVQAPETSNWQSEAELPLLSSLMPMLPSDPMMPPYDAPPSFQGQSSTVIIHGEKKGITSPPPFQGGQSSTGMIQDEIEHQNRICLPTPDSSFAGYS